MRWFKKKKTFHEVKQYPDANGYLMVDMLNNKGVWETRYVHDLVAEAFVGPRPGPDYVVEHINGVKTDNHATNLRWVKK